MLNLDCNKPQYPNAMFISGRYNDAAFLGCHATNEVAADAYCYPKKNNTTPIGCYAYDYVGARCAKCDIGYFKTGTSTCSACMSQCVKCTSAGTCQRCTQGYVLSGTLTSHICRTVSSFPGYPNYLYSPKYQSLYPAANVVLPAIPATMTLNGTLNYTYSTTIPVPVESTVLIHAKVVFTDSGNAANNIYSHHDVMVVWNKPDGTKEYLQTRSLPYDPTHTFPKGPLQFDVVNHFTPAQTMSIEIWSLHPAQVTQFRYSVVNYDISQPVYFQSNISVGLICNRNLSLWTQNGQCVLSPQGSYGAPVLLGNFNQIAGICKPEFKRCSTASVGIECFDGFTLTPDKRCLNCSTNCFVCYGLSSNCSSCPINSASNLSASILTIAGDDTEIFTCKPCFGSCLECEAYTLACLVCPATKSINTIGGKYCWSACSNGTVNNDMGECLVCNVPNCESCSGTDSCNRCSEGFALSPIGNVCYSVSLCNSVPSIEVVAISMTYLEKKKNIGFYFSRSISIATFLAKLTLDYDSKLISVVFRCSGDLQYSSECLMDVTFPDKTQVWQMGFFAHFKSWTDAESCAAIASSTMAPSNSIAHYEDYSQTSQMLQYSKYSSTAIKAILGVSFVTTTNAFSSLLRLTQYIELYTYLNINMPDNLKAFLQYFSEDIFNLLYNPFDRLPASRNDPPLFIGSGNDFKSGLFLQNAGTIILAMGFFAIFKIFFGFISPLQSGRLFSWLRDLFGTNWWMFWLDSVFFEFFLAINVQFFTGIYVQDGWELINLLCGLVTLAVLIVELLAVAKYGYWIKTGKVNTVTSTPSSSQRAIPLGADELTLMTMASPDSQRSDRGLVDHRTSAAPKQKAWKDKLTEWLQSRQLVYILDTVKLSSPIATQYILIQQIRTAISIILLLLLRNLPFIQVVTIASLQTLVSVFWIIFRPLKNPRDSFKQSLNNSLLSFVMASSVVYTPEFKNTISPKSLYKVWGTIHILVISVIFLLESVFTAIDIVKTIARTYKSLVNRKTIKPTDSVGKIKNWKKKTVFDLIHDKDLKVVKKEQKGPPNLNYPKPKSIGFKLRSKLILREELSNQVMKSQNTAESDAQKTEMNFEQSSQLRFDPAGLKKDKSEQSPALLDVGLLNTPEQTSRQRGFLNNRLSRVSVKKWASARLVPE